MAESVKRCISVSRARTRGSTLLEFICAENDRNPVDAAGHTGLQ